jgi:hypothetical protein
MRSGPVTLSLVTAYQKQSVVRSDLHGTVSVAKANSTFYIRKWKRKQGRAAERQRLKESRLSVDWRYSTLLGAYPYTPTGSGPHVGTEQSTGTLRRTSQKGRKR